MSKVQSFIYTESLSLFINKGMGCKQKVIMLNIGELCCELDKNTMAIHAKNVDRLLGW